MWKINRFLALGLVWMVSGSVFASRQDTLELKSKPVYGREARTITEVLSGNHYRKIRLNDSLSSAILDRYIQELDNNRTYFLESDIKSFEKYRYSIDDLTRAENVAPAYEIYTVFRKRYIDRMNYVLNTLINQDHNYAVNEFYETNREKEPWAKSTKEMNEIWRKVIKSQALSLKLAGKKPDEIKETLKKRFERFEKSVAQFNSEDVFSVYMNSITEAYDPHTNYFSPKASDLFKQSMSLSLEGIGAQLQTDNDYTKVANVIPGGPADKSGLLHNNDYIVGVAQGKEGDMVDVIGWRIDDVVKLIKGPKGTVVRIQIIPSANGIGGATQEIVLTRDKVKLEDQAAKKSVIHYQSEGRDQKLGVITLPSFYLDYDAYQRGDVDYRSTTRDVKKLIGELKTEGVDGIVMDLRNNGGGSLPEAVDLTGLFIKDGPVVQVKSSNNRIDVLPDDDNGVFYSGPLVVLTNRFSASASEIFAGAIQDYKRGVIVGETTYGKGTVQSVLDLNKIMREKETIGSLKVTFQKFYRVTGSSTQHKGVTPDVLLPSALDASQYGESASPNALPWDVIKAAAFQPNGDVNDKLIAKLNKAYLDRSKFDVSLKKYIQNTEELKKNLSETKISLNETVRKKELEETEKRKAQEKMDTKLTSKEGLPVNDLQKMDDEVLREGLMILSEILTKRVG
jgi:carboxyl-terminal processing protease